MMKGETQIPSFEEIIQIQRELGRVQLNNWTATSAFNGPWWYLLIVSLIIWALFLLIFDKKNTYPFVLMILVSQTIFSTFDGEFFSSGMIHYNISLLPIRFPFIPISFSFVPVAAVFMYKYCKQWKTYLIAVFVTSLALTFAFKYILLPLHVVTFQRGTYWYVFPSPFITFILSRFLTERILRLQFRHQD